MFAHFCLELLVSALCGYSRPLSALLLVIYTSKAHTSGTFMVTRTKTCNSVAVKNFVKM